MESHPGEPSPGGAWIPVRAGVRQTIGGGGPAFHMRVPLSTIPLFCRVTEGQLLCITPPGAAVASVPIQLQVGGAEVPGSWTFHYQEDPVILSISPNCGYT